MMTRRRFLTILGSCLLPLGCAVAPHTGRRQLMLIPEGEEIALGEEAYRQILRDSVLSNHPDAVRIVRTVGDRIARVADKSEYRWEFRVIDDPEMVNAFAVPGGKVAVYTGIFPVARDEAGLAVVLGHEVAHALARHAGERISQSQLLGAGLAIAGATGVNPQLLQLLGLGASVGVILPFSRSQESEADEIGLILMAKAGYDPRVALELWERMEKKESARDRRAPPEFLSTHPSYETRTQNLRAFISKALTYYRASGKAPEMLPPLKELDSAKARAERELLNRIQAINRQIEEPRGDRAVVEAMGYTLRVDPSLLYRERQQLRLGYGQYAALRAVSHLGRSPLRRVLADYQAGVRWSDLTENHGARLTDLISWMGELRRTAAAIQGRLRLQPPARGYRTR